MVDLGVESASQNRLDILNKKTTVDQNKEAIALLRANDIVSIVQTIIGFSDETIEGFGICQQRCRVFLKKSIFFIRVQNDFPENLPMFDWS